MTTKKPFMAVKWRPWIVPVVSLLLVPVILVVGYRSYKATEEATFEEFNQRQLTLAKQATAWIEHRINHLAEALWAVETSRTLHTWRVFITITDYSLKP